MKLFEIRYLDDLKVKTLYVQANNKLDAKEKLKNESPDIKMENILNIEQIQVGAQEYGTGILISKIVSFAGWAMIAIGVFMVVTFVMMSSGISLLIGGLSLVMLGQINRSMLEASNNTKQILDEIRIKNQ